MHYNKYAHFRLRRRTASDKAISRHDTGEVNNQGKWAEQRLRWKKSAGGDTFVNKVLNEVGVDQRI